MLLAERLQRLRKEKGYSQEQLSGLVGVSRQAISKWESGQSCPDINNLISLSNIYSVSIDNILKGGDADRESEKSSGETSKFVNVVDIHSLVRFEYKSKLSLCGLPLVHIKSGYLFSGPAKGIIAIGDSAIGVLALGGAAAGLIAVGGLAIGALALGGLSIGVFSFGGLAVGSHVAMGGGAISNFLAMGGYAGSNHVAIGGVADAAVALSGNNNVYSSLVINSEEIAISQEAFINAARRELPSRFWEPFLNMVSNFLGKHAIFHS